jgi:hypothetical protein
MLEQERTIAVKHGKDVNPWIIIMPLRDSVVRRFIAVGCATLVGVPQVHASAFSTTAPMVFLSPQAETFFGNNPVFLDTGSTLGMGREFSTPLSSKFDLRIGFHEFRDFELHSDKRTNQRFDLKLRSTSFLFDWHPFGGSFRTSIGMLINSHRLRADALPTQVFHVGNIALSEIIADGRIDVPDTLLSDIEQIAIRRVLNAADTNGNISARALLTARGRVRFNSLAPYLGIGWGNATRGERRLYYSFDLGVAFHGSPDVDLDVQGIIADVAREGASQELRTFLANEEKKLKDELASLDMFPVVSFGLSYRF